ncbi:HEPN domain-containing protein [Actinobacillus pleuropneumoniae]|uniref:HEPN domain-containing protein n=1 Tax=Actinobacillus pleuropneumoniae TaxID=715 RepID=UPI003F7C7AD6
MISVILENKNKAIYELDEIKKNITFIFNEIESGSFGNKELYRNLINKVFIIDLYTVWEQFVKKSVGDIYDEYRNVLFSDSSVIKRVLNENIKKARDIKLNEKGAVKFREILIASNNIRYLSLKNIISSIGFDINKLLLDLKESENIKLKIREIKDYGVSLVRDEDEQESELQDIANGIYTIVSLRNEYAHTGKVNQFFNKKQMSSFCELFIGLLEVIYTYMSKELHEKIYKYYFKEKGTIRIDIKKILYENKPNLGRYSTSLRIDSKKRIRNINNFSFFIEYNDNYYKAEKVKIEDCDEKEINEIKKGEQFITINTELNVRKQKNITNLLVFCHRSDDANIRLG